MRVFTLVRMDNSLTVILSVLLSSLFSVDCEGMHTCQNGRCIDSNFVCVIVNVFFQWIVRVFTFVRMDNAWTVILSVLWSSFFSVDCEGMHTCQNGQCILMCYCYFQWIVRVCTLVRMADVLRVI